MSAQPAGGKPHMMHIGFSDEVAARVDFDGAHVTALLHRVAADSLRPDTVRRLAGLAPLDIPHRVNFDDYDDFFEEFVAWGDRFVDRFGVPAGIVGLREHTTVPAARLRERYGVPGTDLRTSVLCRDKVLMKAALAGSGVRVPQFADLPAADPARLREIAAAFRGPVVLKPKSQAGALGVRVFEDPQAFLRHAERYGIDDGCELEQFVGGRLYHFDGLVRDGRLRFFTLSRYVGTPYDFRARGTALGSVTVDDPELAAAGRGFTERVLAAIGLRDSSFHLEAFRPPAGGDGEGAGEGDGDSDGEFVFLEIANRYGGGLIAEVLEAVHGLDIARESIAACTLTPFAAGQPAGTPPYPGRGSGGWLYLPLRESRPCAVTRVDGLDRLPSSVVHRVVPRVGQVMNTQESLFDVSGRFVVHGATTEEVQRDLERIIAVYGVEVRVVQGAGRRG